MGISSTQQILFSTGEFLIPQGFRESDNSRITCSVLVGTPREYQNKRLFQPRLFFGYFQVFDEEAVTETVPINFTTQRVWERDRDGIAAMEDRCRKYACLVTKIDWIGRFLTLLNPAIAASLGGYPFTSDASNYGDDFFRDTPTSIAWFLEPGVSVLLELTWHENDLSACNPFYARIPAPEGCRQPGERPPQTGACVPTTPQTPGGY